MLYNFWHIQNVEKCIPLYSTLWQPLILTAISSVLVLLDLVNCLQFPSLIDINYYIPN